MNPERDAFLACLYALAAIVFYVVICLLINGCGSMPPAPVQYVDKVVAVPETRRCARSTPPALAPIGAPVVCLPGMVCLTVLDAATVADNVERLRSWVVETWTLCAPEVK